MGFLVKVEAKAPWAPQARRVPRVNVAPLAPLVKMASPGPWAFLDPLELRGLLARKGTREKWVPPVTKAAKETREMRARLDQQGYGVWWDTQALREQMGLRDAGDPQASLGRKEMME